MVGKCPECGFEIRDNRASNAVTKFAEQYQSADVEKQISLVQSFPIPNNKEDLYEFTSLAMPLAMSLHKMPLWQIIVFVIGIDIALALLLSYINTTLGFIIGFMGFMALIGLVITSDSGNDDDKQNKREKKLGKAWEAKLDQSLIKSKFFSSNDPQFAAKIAQVSKAYINRKRVSYILLAIVWIAAFASVYMFVTNPPEGMDDSDDENIEYSVDEDTEYSIDDDSDYSEEYRKAQKEIDSLMSVYETESDSEPDDDY
jgi:hypothetical protein